MKPSIRFDLKNIAIILGALLFFVVIFMIFSPKEKPGQESSNQNTTAVSATPSATVKSEDMTVGKGATAVNGSTVTVNYIGYLTDGKKFDSSYDRKQPFTFKVGNGDVIKGWDLGVIGMKVGGKRKLTIPPDLAYGPSGNPPTIPPNATLVFEIELLKVE